MKIIFSMVFVVCIMCFIKFLFKHESLNFSPTVVSFDEIEVKNIRVKEQIELSNENYSVIIKNDKKNGISMSMCNLRNGARFNILIVDDDTVILANGSENGSANFSLMNGKFGPSISLNATEASIGTITLTGTNSTSEFRSNEIALYDSQLLAQRNKSIESIAPKKRVNEENTASESRKYNELLKHPFKTIKLSSLANNSEEKK